MPLWRTDVFPGALVAPALSLILTHHNHAHFGSSLWALVPKCVGVCVHTSVNGARSLEMSVGPDGGWLQGHLHISRDISVSVPGPCHVGQPWGQDACVQLCVGMS